MRYPSIARAAGIFVATLFAAQAAQANPIISNVTAEQRQDGSQLVDISYDLSGADGPIEIEMRISRDNGINWNIIPRAEHMTGHVGPGVTNGTNRQIVWDAGEDQPQVYWHQARVRLRTVTTQTTVIDLPEDVTLELVRIPGGTFPMGAPIDEEDSSNNERPVHFVEIGYDFYMGATPVTQAQWLAVMGEFPGEQSAGESPDRPVHRVSWVAAQGFVNALNALGHEGTYRLPSEAEWEYACRAGSLTRFYFGDGGGDLVDYAWYLGNDFPQGVKPVAHKLPNAFGLYDMHGNVWEWVQDRYNSDYIGAPEDGSAWEEGSSSRVLRGGGYNSRVQDCRSANRTFTATTNTSGGGWNQSASQPRESYAGLRIVWTP